MGTTEHVPDVVQLLRDSQGMSSALLHSPSDNHILPNVNSALIEQNVSWHWRGACEEGAARRRSVVRDVLRLRQRTEGGEEEQARQ